MTDRSNVAAHIAPAIPPERRKERRNKAIASYELKDLL
jgi:hypothetical protein